MSLLGIRNRITVFATISALVFILLSYFFPKHSVLILSIEIIILPSIYIIGNAHIEEELKKEYESIISAINKDMKLLKSRYR